MAVISDEDAVWPLLDAKEDEIQETDGRSKRPVPGARYDYCRYRTASQSEAEGRPIRVGCIGAGFMGQGLTNQIVNSVPGMRMVGGLRRVRAGSRLFAYAGQATPLSPTTQGELEDAIRRRQTRRYRRCVSAGVMPNRSTCSST